MRLRNFSKEKFKVFHPGGNIGSSLLLAKDIMMSGNNIPVAKSDQNLKIALKIMNRKKLGVIIVKKNNYISGLLTDGDL